MPFKKNLKIVNLEPWQLSGGIKGEIVDLHGRVQNADEIPNMWRKDDREIASTVFRPSILRHIVITHDSKVYKGKPVAHGVIEAAHPELYPLFLPGVDRLADGSMPDLKELGGKVVDPKFRGRSLARAVDEERIFSISETGDSVPVAVIDERNQDALHTMINEFGAFIVTQTSLPSSGTLNLLVFPRIAESDLIYTRRELLSYTEPDE